jgi:hypothetical protein
MQLKRKYKHKRTGAIVFSSGLIIGNNWVEVTENEVVETVEQKIITKEAKKEAKETAQDEKEELEGIQGVTKKEIMQELDALGIEYNPRATKKELYDLMMYGR